MLYFSDAYTLWTHTRTRTHTQTHVELLTHTYTFTWNENHSKSKEAREHFVSTLHTIFVYCWQCYQTVLLCVYSFYLCSGFRLKWIFFFHSVCKMDKAISTVNIGWSWTATPFHGIYFSFFLFKFSIFVFYFAFPDGFFIVGRREWNKKNKSW